MNIANRNEDLDDLRGFAMIWVIIIHCLYWPGLFAKGNADIIKSFLLIEMPLFFFITGASNSIGRKKSAISFYILRLQRILLPYWIYAIICIMLNIVAKKIMPAHDGQSELLIFTLPEVISPKGHLPYLVDALWFVPIYIYVIIIFPLFRWYFDKYERNIIRVLPLLILASLLCIVSITSERREMPDIKLVLFYSFWTYLGMYFPMLNGRVHKKEKMAAIPIFIFCIASVFLIVQHFHQSINMQDNKFPPNGIFLLYTFGALSIFYLFFKDLLLFIRFLNKNSIFYWIFDNYKKNCYTVFLYHPLSFLLLFMIIRFTKSNNYLINNQLIGVFLYIIFIIPTSAVLGKLFSWGERIKIINK